MADRPQQLAHLEHLGDATRFAGQIHALIPKCSLLENFTPLEVRKQDRWNTQQLIAVVEPGRVLGEMSMIDGEPRFATCVAVQPTLVAVLDRESLARIIVEQPLLGAKILMELVLMLSQRLRATSDRLMQLLDEQGPHGAGHV